MKRCAGMMVGFAALICGAAPAQAAIITTQLNGIFADGSSLSGSLTQETDRLPAFDIAITVGSLATFNAISFGQRDGSGNVRLTFRNSDNETLSLDTRDGVAGSFAFSPSGGTLLASSNFTVDGVQTFLRSGSFGAPTAAVPEPATWAMMLVGFGGIGFAMRRRKRNATTTVAFA